MRRQKIIPIILCILFFIPSLTHAGWEYVKPMPLARFHHDAALGPNGRIYVMGGFPWYEHSGAFSNYSYDIKTDSWKYERPVPGGFMMGEYLYYDEESKRWKVVKKAKYGEIVPYTMNGKMTRNTGVGRQGSGLAVVTGKDGLIYWTGGRYFSRKGPGENFVLPFDPVKGLWPDVGYERVDISPTSYTYKNIYKTDVPFMLERRMDHEAVVTSDGKIYVLGGRQYEIEKRANGVVNIHYDKAKVLDIVECYDPETHKWSYKAPMPSKRFLFAAVVGKDDRIYVIGGAGGWPYDENMPVLDTVDIYDPKTDSWSSGKPMPKPRESHAGVLGSDGKIYVIGGSTGAKDLPSNDVFIYDPEKNRWKRGPSMRKRRALLAAVSTPDGKIYAIGGTDAGAYEGRKAINFFLPKSAELDTGRVQKTVEVLDITKRNLWD